MKRESRSMRLGCSSGLTRRYGTFVVASFVALLITTFSIPIASAWTTMNIPGNWDGFNTGNATPPCGMNKFPPPATPAGADWFTNVMFVAASGGDVTNGTYALKLAADGSFGSNWGG